MTYDHSGRVGKERTYEPANPFRQRLTFVEGCDQTGKSTLMRALNFDSGHDCLVYDRGPINRIVMTRFFAGYVMQGDFPPAIRAAVYLGYVPELRLLLDRLVMNKAIAIVYLWAEPETLQERMRKNGHYVLNKHTLETQHGLFLDELNRYSEQIPVKSVYTGGMENSGALTAQLVRDWMGMSKVEGVEPHYPAECLEG